MDIEKLSKKLGDIRESFIVQMDSLMEEMKRHDEMVRKQNNELQNLKCTIKEINKTNGKNTPC